MQNILRHIPKMDDLLADEGVSRFVGVLSSKTVLEILREEIENLRAAVKNGGFSGERAQMLEYIKKNALPRLEAKASDRPKRVINATGVIIHTNLGRAPIAEKAAEKINEVLTGYTNLEYDVNTGERRTRTFFAEELVKELTGAEAALVVNNNAAALYIALASLCTGKEVVVSRGELVEIGDSFRILDIMEKSGCIVKEAGATNKTKISDYESLIGGNTAMLVKVHRSNFKITGFTGEAAAAELAELAGKHGLITLEDMGSGILPNLSKFGVNERTVTDALNDGVDIVTFSGDKMLGGPQAGIVAGKKEYVERMKRNPMYRCLRPDKMCLAVIEATLRTYLTDAYLDLPIMKMLLETPEKILLKAERLKTLIGEVEGLSLRVGQHGAALGGGAMPGETVESSAVYIKAESKPAAEVENLLRKQAVPVVATVKDGEIALDVRTIDESDFEYIAGILREVAKPLR